jgi:RNA polymerase sigma-70 factor (ECF subfamily)
MKTKEPGIIPTRASLLKRLRNWKDDESWHEFFNLYWKLIYGVARKAGLREGEAQDVVQETLISVARHMPAFKYDPSLGSFKSWLLTMTRWRIIAQFRKRNRLPDLPSYAGDSSSGTDPINNIADPSGQPLDRVWDAEWERNLLTAAIDKVKRLDPEKFQIFDLYVNKEWAPQKVAERFNISVNQVYQIKSRLTDSIRDEVKRLEKELT